MTTAKRTRVIKQMELYWKFIILVKCKVGSEKYKV